MSRVRSNRVCFTLNNYTDEAVTLIDQFLDARLQDGHLTYAVIGMEIGESGTPHLQGFAHLHQKHHPSKSCGIKFWKDLLPEGHRMHFEGARGNDIQNMEYCSKEGPYKEWGTPSGNTNKWSEIIQLASHGDTETLMESYPEEYVKHKFQIAQIMRDAECKSRADKTIPVLRDWQQRVLDMLHNQTDRHILFVVDIKGGKGKSTLAQHLLSKEHTWGCQGGKIADLMHSYHKKATIAVFDMARCNNPDYYPWNFMENIKNGWFTSTKYQGGFHQFTPPKIVVFMNQDPPRDKLSEDRYQVLFI